MSLKPRLNSVRRSTHLGHLAAALTAGTSLMASAAAAEPLKVVASFTVLADIAENIGGDDVSVDSLVGPDSDSHVFEPSPSHVRALAGADIVVVNGLAFEGWMDRLIDASGFDGSVIVASANAGVIESGNDHHDHEEDGHDQDDDDGHDDHGLDGHEDDHGHEEEDHDHDRGPEDAHAWQSVSEGRSYAQTIADALAEADPDNADAYRDRLAGYDAELEALDHEVRELMGEIPDGATTVIVPHASFTYFERDYGIEFLSPSGLTTEAEPTAAQMAGLVDLIHEHGVAAILAENVSSPRMVELLAEEAGMSLGGTLYSDALSEQDGPAPTYIEMLRHNAAVIHRAITR